MTKGFRFYIAALTIALVTLWFFTVIQNSEFVELKKSQTKLFESEIAAREAFDSMALKRIDELDREVSFLEARVNHQQKKIELLESRIDDLAFEVPKYPSR